MLSHPNKELKQHLYEVKEIGLTIYDNKKNIWSENHKIRKMLAIVLETHDYGKATVFFQEYLKEPKKYIDNTNLKSHSRLSAYMTYWYIIKELEDEFLATIGFFIVTRHHGELKNFNFENFCNNSEYEIKCLKQQLESFNWNYFNIGNHDKQNIIELIKELDGIDFEDKIDEIIKKVNIESWLLINYLFSILISADKGCAIFHNSNIDINILENNIINKTILDNDIVEQYKLRVFNKGMKEIDIYREEIYKTVEDSIERLELNKNRILSINIPTGYGKTLTSLNAAIKLDSRLNNDYKIIYALPFTSIIDQNVDVFNDVLEKYKDNSSVLIKHHYLAEKKFNYNSDEHENLFLDFDISEYLIENWDSKIVVTTFVQVFHSIFTNNNRKLKKFHNLSNSIIILDEIQTIPNKYWYLVKSVLNKICECMNSYVIFVTATMPLIFREDEDEIIELVSNKGKNISELKRIEMEVSYIKERMDIDSFIDVLWDDIEEYNDDSFLVILNTIKSSIKVYEGIKTRIELLDGRPINIVYLSNNVIPFERKQRIKLIKSIISKANSNEQIIVISTQLVEAGVDIDFDRVYRDLGPLDSINQAAGRCNRNGIRKTGIVKVFSLEDTRNNNLYAQYIYDQVLLNATTNLMNNIESTLSENEITALSNKYYHEIDKRNSDEISQKLLKNIGDLKYEEAFDRKNSFQLISKTYKTLDVFIVVNQKAKEVYLKYREIMKDNDRFERKKGFDKIKNEFLDFVISIPESKYFLSKKEGFNIIENDLVKELYDMETGYILEDKDNIYQF